MRLIVFAFILIASLAVRPASANEVIVGINSVTNHPMSAEQQDEFIEQLRKNGVKTIREGLDDNHTHMIVRAYERGIGTVVILHVQGNHEHTAPKDPSVGRLWAAHRDSTVTFQRTVAGVC